MANFIEAVGESVNRAACVILGGLAGQEELLRYVLEPLQTGNPGYNGLGALYAQRCNMPPPERPQPPFIGGQCPGVLYDVSYAYDFRNNIINAPPGTITPNAGTSRVTGRVGGVRANNSQFLAFGELYGDFGVVNIGGGSSGFADNIAVENIRITNIVRVGGLPDNCGNPTPIPPVLPPGGNVYNDNPTFINNEGDTVNIPVNITLGYAQVNFNGQVSIPISLNFPSNPEYNFDGDFNYHGGDININPGNPAIPRPGKDGNKDNYTAPDTPAIPPEIPPEVPTPDPEPESEYISIIRAAIVTTTEWLGQETVIFQDINPNIYAPSLGYISFLIDVGGRQAWTNDIPVKNRRAFIECPWEAGAIDVRGTPRPGNNIVVSPVYVSSTVQPTYPD